MAENRYEYTFTLSINGGEPQSIEGEGFANTWGKLADDVWGDIRRLADMNEGMGLIDWKP
jgi:hypothetical protein